MGIKLLLAYIVLAVSITGCVGNQEYSLPQAVSIKIDSQPFVVSAPKNFCVDQSSAKRGKNVITVLVVDCLTLETKWNKSLGRRPMSALLSATVTTVDRESFSIDELLKSLENPMAIKELAISKELNKIILHDLEKVEEMLFIYLEQLDTQNSLGQDSYFGRLFFIFDNKLVSLSIINFSKQYSTKSSMRHLIIDFAKSIRASNVQSKISNNLEENKL